MSFLRDIEGAVNRFLRHGEIASSVAHYEQAVGAKADQAQTYADAGSFRSQVERLFTLATPHDYPEFEAIARSVVSSCLTNRYYRPADYLSDVADALESHTFLAAGPEGEPGLQHVPPEHRRHKIDRVCRAWLVPAKIASLESLVAAHARLLGRALPYAALSRFERQAAQLFALLELSEVRAVEQRLAAFVEAWPRQPGLKLRFGEPALGLQAVLECLEGRLEGGEGSALRTRVGWPLRLANALPQDRSHMLEIALARLGLEAPAPTPTPVPVVAPAAAPSPRRKRAAPRPAPAPVADAQEGSGPLLLLLSCPKCGGAFTADDETVSTECGYCSSLLILSAAERDEVYVDDDRFEGGDDVLSTLVMYRVQARRGELISEYRSRQEDPEAQPTEGWLRDQLQHFETRLRESSRVLRAERVFVPYWHMSGLVAQGLLGRRTDGPKVVRVRAFAVEHTVPGYDGRFNLRDRGLRLAHSRVHPLTVERVHDAGAFLPWVALPEQEYREVEKWRGQSLDPGFDAVAKHGEILYARRVVAYRPYWLVEIDLAGQVGWVLGDGVFRTIGGYPTSEEVAALLRARVRDPLRSGEESYRRVHVIASRCPDCGHEQHLDPRHHVVVCPNCHLGLLASAAGIRVVGYDHGTREGETVDGEYLPFWRYAFEMETSGGQVVRDLPGLKRAVFGEGGPSAWTPLGDALFVPAFRLLGTEPGDETFRRLAEHVHTRRNEISAGKIPLGLRTRAWGASLDAEEAAELARLTLLALHGPSVAAQLNAKLFGQRLTQPLLTLKQPRLTFLPFEREGQELSLWPTPVRVASLLLEGGPRLDALRVSVHRARAVAAP